MARYYCEHMWPLFTDGTDDTPHPCPECKAAGEEFRRRVQAGIVDCPICGPDDRAQLREGFRLAQQKAAAASDEAQRLRKLVTHREAEIALLNGALEEIERLLEEGKR